MSAAVELTEVSKTFGATRAVTDLSLNVPRGAIYGFIGPNGSGKTTTLRLITRILEPDQGRVVVLGEMRRHARSAKVGYLPEERGLYRRMKVRPLLRFLGELKAGRRVDEEIEHWIDRLDLRSHADKKVEALSKGTAQRIQFIAAVVGRPELIVLDEPFSGLDPVNAEVLRQVVLGLRQDGATVILSTHDMAVAEQMCDFVLMIFRGRKVLDGTVARLKAEHGADTVCLESERGAGALATLPGVTHVRDLGRRQELRLARGTDPQSILRAALDLGPVRHFEVHEPSLHEIFIRIAGAPEEAPRA